MSGEVEACPLCREPALRVACEYAEAFACESCGVTFTVRRGSAWTPLLQLAAILAAGALVLLAAR